MVGSSNLESVYLREFLGVYGGAGDEEFEVGSETRDVLDQSEQDVCVQRPLMRLVDYHNAEVKTSNRVNTRLIHTYCYDALLIFLRLCASHTIVILYSPPISQQV